MSNTPEDTELSKARANIDYVVSSAINSSDEGSEAVNKAKTDSIMQAIDHYATIKRVGDE